jgi:hypothetical protein
MAIQILPQYNSGERIGSALGEGLTALANFKIGQLQQRKALSRLQSGLTPIFGSERAEALSNLPESILRPLVQEELAKPREAEARQRLESGLSELFGTEKAKTYANLPKEVLNPIVKQKVSEPTQAAFANALAQVNQGQPPVVEGLNPQQAFQVNQAYQQKIQADETRKLREETAKANALSKQAAETSKRQAQINTANKPYIERLAKGVTLAENIKDKATKMLDLLDTGKVASGLAGYTPNVLQTSETQQFDALANELATIIAGNSGVATNFKIKTAQSYKPNVTQRPETQRALINDLIRKSNEVLLREKIKNDLINKNEGEQPKNLETQINNKLKTYEALGNPEDAGEGAIIRNKKTKEVFTVSDGQWREIYGT